MKVHRSFCAVKGVLDLPEGQEVVVIGTLYKDMKLKPSILSEYSKVLKSLLPNFYLEGTREKVD